MNCRCISGSIHRLPEKRTTTCKRFLLVHFYLLDECSEMRRDGRREGVVLVLQGLPNCCERSVSVATGIYFALRRIRNDMLAYPVVDPVSCGSEMRHGPLPTSPPFIPRSLTNAQTISRVPDKKPRLWHAEIRAGMGSDIRPRRVAVGRPPRERDFHRQYRRKPVRCQRVFDA
jgi:hypothetical protein